MMMVPVVSRTLTPTKIGPLALSITPMMIILMTGLTFRHESVGPSQFTTVTTTSPFLREL